VHPLCPRAVDYQTQLNIRYHQHPSAPTSVVPGHKRRQKPGAKFPTSKIFQEIGAENSLHRPVIQWPGPPINIDPGLSGNKKKWNTVIICNYSYSYHIYNPYCTVMTSKASRMDVFQTSFLMFVFLKFKWGYVSDTICCYNVLFLVWFCSYDFE
jgi:hypothetical protein